MYNFLKFVREKHKKEGGEEEIEGGVIEYEKISEYIQKYLQLNVS